MTTLPPAVALTPRQDPRMVALQRYVSDSRRRTQFSEYHHSDERQDMVAIASFMDAHPEAAAGIVNHPPNNIGLWAQSYIHHAKHGAPAMLFPLQPVWLTLASQGDGVAGQGMTPNGVSGAMVAHRNGNGNHPLYRNTTPADTSNGIFNTPGRRR